MNDKPTAFLRQAISDFAVYEAMNKCVCGNFKGERCQKIHYLLMTWEKVVKSSVNRKERHQVLGNFIKQLPLKYPSFLGTSMKQVLHQHRRLTKLAEMLEKWFPVGGDLDRKNVEYPYRHHGKYIAPCQNEFNEFAQQDEIFLAYFLKNFIAEKADLLLKKSRN